MITYTFVSNDTNERITLRSRQFEGVESPDYNDVRTFNLSEAKKLYESLGKCIEKAEYVSVTNKKKELQEKKNQMIKLQDDAVRLQREIDAAEKELKTSQ